WQDPRLILLVLNNRDLNQVTWEQRVLAGDPRFEASQELPAMSYARFAEQLGLRGVLMEKPEDIIPGWEAALAADRPVVVDAHTDPEVPPLPPHITLKQARNFTASIVKGDPRRWRMIKRSAKDAVESYVPGRGRSDGKGTHPRKRAGRTTARRVGAVRRERSGSMQPAERLVQLERPARRPPRTLPAVAAPARKDGRALANALRERIGGEVRFSDGDRGLYADDASNYRFPPLGVVIPQTADDIVETIAACRTFGAPVAFRGGGTGLAGQTVNAAVV